MSENIGESGEETSSNNNKVRSISVPGILTESADDDPASACHIKNVPVSEQVEAIAKNLGSFSLCTPRPGSLFEVFMAIKERDR